MLVGWETVATELHLGEVCLKPVFILKDLLKRVCFCQLGQGDGMEGRDSGCPTAGSPLLACTNHVLRRKQKH